MLKVIFKLLLGGGVTFFFCAFLLLAHSPRPALVHGVPFGKVILDRHGKLMRITTAEDQKYRIRQSLDQISPQIIQETLSYEDKYFYSHFGVNPAAIARAAFSMCKGSRKMGASTITMQVARLRYNLKTSSLGGKLRQIWKALQLEVHYTKQEILEAYFNLAPYGGNIEGIGAASRIYFDVPPSSLTETEAIALARVPQNPIKRAPVKSPFFGLPNNTHAKTASLNTPFAVRNPGNLPFSAPHFTTWLLKNTDKEIITSTIDSKLQKFLVKQISNFIGRGKRFGIKNASAMLVDWRTMEVVAFCGSANFFDNLIEGQIDGTNALRSPGSTLKPFIYGLALDQGLIHPKSILIDSPRSFGGYDPQNFDGFFKGPVAAEIALKESRNLPAIVLAEQLQDPDLYSFLEKADIRFPHSSDYYGLALTLGGAEITMRDLAGLYAMLPNKGLWQPLQFTKAGQTHVTKKLLSPSAAWLVLDMLRHPGLEIRSFGKQIPAIYKTGTSNGFRDAWTCGIIGQYVAAIWVGNFNNQANPLFVGAKTALPLFMEIANGLGLCEKLETPLSIPPDNLTRSEVCKTTGDFDLAHCPDKGETWIISGVTRTKSKNIIRSVLIDQKTGLRACKKTSDTKEQWFEFWPGDVLSLFEEAGIHKPQPPEWLEECRKKIFSAVQPKIITPKKNVIYRRSVKDGKIWLPLQAVTETGVNRIHWYANKEYIGSSRPGEIIFWETSFTGQTFLQAVDDTGASIIQKCEIDLAP